MRTYDGMVRKLIYAMSNTTVTEEVAVVSCLGAGSYDITLPLASDASGLIFVIRCDDDALIAPAEVRAVSADVNNIYIPGAAAADNVVMRDMDDYTILYSDGNNWYQLAGEQT